MKTQKTTSKVTMLLISLVSHLLGVDHTSANETLGTNKLGQLVLVNYLPKDTKIALESDIKDDTVLTLFVSDTTIDFSKVTITPTSENGGFTVDSENTGKFIFTYSLKPQGQKFRVLRAEVKGKTAITDLQKALAAYKDGRTKNGNKPTEAAYKALEEAWIKSVTKGKVTTTEIAVANIVDKEIKGITDKTDQTKLNDVKEDIHLVGEKFTEGFKPGITGKFHLWGSTQTTAIDVGIEVDTNSSLGSQLSYKVDTSGQDLKIGVESEEEAEMKKLWEIFSKDSKPDPDTPKGNGDGEEEDPWYKTWWFITLMIVLVVVILIAVAFIFRKSILGTKGKKY